MAVRDQYSGRVCAVCGVGIAHKRSNAIYCSPACNLWAHKSRRRDPSYGERTRAAHRRRVTYRDAAGRKQLTYGLDPGFAALLRGDPCPYCDQRSDTIDHIEPRDTGGTDAWENLTGA